MKLEKKKHNKDALFLLLDSPLYHNNYKFNLI